MEGVLVSWATWLLQVFDWAKLGVSLDAALKIIIHLSLLFFFVRALMSPRDLLDKTEQGSWFFFFSLCGHHILLICIRDSQFIPENWPHTLMDRKF